jgi:hypothetical protein
MSALILEQSGGLGILLKQPVSKPGIVMKSSILKGWFFSRGVVVAFI